jgi:hypothetical protein
MPTLAAPQDGDCTCCEDGALIADLSNEAPGECDQFAFTVELSPCATAWYFYFDPHSTGDGLYVNDEYLGGCDPDVFDPEPVEDTIDVADSGTFLDIYIDGCCGVGSPRRSSWEGFITQYCT